VLIAADIGNNIDALAGDDWIILDSKPTTVTGGDGRDMVSFAEFLPDGNQEGISYLSIHQAVYKDYDFNNFTSISEVEGLTGTSLDDLFVLGSGNVSTFRGLGGKDTFSIRNANQDVGLDIDGGASVDLITFQSSIEDVSLSLLRGVGWEGAAKGNTYANIENVIGSRGDDTITGDHGDNRIFGEAKFVPGFGDDVLMGNGGDDYIFAGNGYDRVIFGYDQDQYEITRIGERTIVDYIGPGPGDGRDTVDFAEVLQFADGDFIL